ncbi:MAG: hypothetical protein QOI69_21 [Pseudonocardiales bacterium]|nr:hypothetical protein [Pseudonocardiales bacterium]
MRRGRGERGRDRWRQRHGTTDQLTEGERNGAPAAGAERGRTPSVAALFKTSERQAGSGGDMRASALRRRRFSSKATGDPAARDD